jgi:hypothetical protein
LMGFCSSVNSIGLTNLIKSLINSRPLVSTYTLQKQMLIMHYEWNSFAHRNLFNPLCGITLLRTWCTKTNSLAMVGILLRFSCSVGQIPLEPHQEWNKSRQSLFYLFSQFSCVFPKIYVHTSHIIMRYKSHIFMWQVT